MQGTLPETNLQVCPLKIGQDPEINIITIQISGASS